MSAEKEQIHMLFAQFLEVCNQAMEAHKDEFPYKHIWEAAEQANHEKGMHITLYDDEPKGDYTLRICQNHIDVEGVEQPCDCHGWRINTSHMRHVIENPQDYINEPEKLDWKWLKERSEG